jgi:flagellar basal-body rod protein FlgG
MTQGLHPLAANMVNQLNRVDVVSNNLANANTVGFKEDHLVEGSFNQYLERMEAENEVPMKLSEVMNTVPKIDGEYANQDMGSVVTTGNGLDFALNEPGLYFKVQNTQTGNIEYTRDGSFKIINGELVTQNGYQVLNDTNQPIIPDQDNLFTTEISIVSIDSKELLKAGNNNYRVKDENSVTNLLNNGSQLLQGALEESNVNTISSMVDLIEAQRKFEQSQKAINAIDQVNAKVIESIGTNK